MFHSKIAVVLIGFLVMISSSLAVESAKNLRQASVPEHQKKEIVEEAAEFVAKHLSEKKAAQKERKVASVKDASVKDGNSPVDVLTDDTPYFLDDAYYAFKPSKIPTRRPTMFPTKIPTVSPTVSQLPTTSFKPTVQPTVAPSKLPSEAPTEVPTTATPSVVPTEAPTLFPSALTCAPSYTYLQDSPTPSPTDSICGCCSRISSRNVTFVTTTTTTVTVTQYFEEDSP